MCVCSLRLAGIVFARKELPNEIDVVNIEDRIIKAYASCTGSEKFLRAWATGISALPATGSAIESNSITISPSKAAIAPETAEVATKERV